MRWALAIVFLFSPALAFSKNFDPPKKMIVKDAVANIRAERVPHNDAYQYDDLQETQVERGEPVLVYEKVGKWVRVECPEQMEFTHHSKWEGYPGWMEQAALTADLSQYHHLQRSTRPSNEERSKILENAAKHLGNPYLWGGRSLHDAANKKTVTGVDCSGLVNWSFRQAGWFVPRDAHEQFMKSRRLEPANLKPADLIFLAKTDKPDKIVHVGFYAGDETLLEAPSSGEKVRKISFKDRFGKLLSDIKSGETVGGRVIYFGSFFMEDQ